MTFTYTGTGSSDLDKLRRMIGDKTITEPLMTDEELNQILAANPGDLSIAAAEACEEIAAAFSRDAVVAVGDLNNPPDQKAKNYLRMAQTFRNRKEADGEAATHCRPGWSKDARGRGPRFTRGMQGDGDAA